MVVFSVTNGWLTSSTFMHSPLAVAEQHRGEARAPPPPTYPRLSPSIPQPVVPPPQAGALVVLFLNLGLMCGSFLQFGVHASLCQCNPFISSA